MRRLKAHLGGIRFRVLLLGVVPLLVSVAMLGTHLISARLGDAREALAEHGRVITRNLSLASEYSLFAGDREALSAIVSRLVEQQRNVLWVAILDRKRQEVVHKGPLPGGFPDHVLLSQPGSGFPTVFEEPIGSAVSMMPDPGGLLEPAEAPQAPGALAPLGWAMVGLSLDGYVKRERLIIVTALALIAAGLAVSVLMALSLGGGIIRPLRRLAGHVEQVRRGEPGVRVQQLSSGDMGRLEAGFNQMAEELDGVQAKLRRQVEDATSRLQRTVAELRYSNKELAHAKERALEAGREKTEFLARMSHEIRTPLNAVIGFARLLNDNHSSWSAREYTQTINQAANQLLYVIDDILNFTRLEAGNLELESIPFDIRSCLEDVVAMISPTAHDKELELALLVHSDVPAHIVGDPTRISQILLNMGNNAVKFTARGQVFIELERAAPEDDSGVEQLRFTVTDSGPGLTPEARGRLFEPFSQGDSTVSRHFGGTGLGLAIAHRLVQLMDGRIGVESEAGEGAQFWFQVPLRAAQAGPGFQPPAEFRNHAVVVVEPEPLTQRALRATLAGWGMQVFNTRDPAGLPDILRAAASAGSGNPLVLVGLAGNERRAGEAVAAYGIVRRSFSGPVLFLVGADRWVPPHAVEIDPNAAWTSKPARRATLCHAMAGLLKIPCAVDAALARRTFGATHEPLQGARVLCAEDNAFNRKLLGYLLQRRGLVVDSVESGKEAVAAVERENYDLILMDLHMPEMDGAQAARLIRKRLGEHTPPIVVLTADVFMDGHAGVKEAGFNGQVIKPVSEEALDAALARFFPPPMPDSGAADPGDRATRARTPQTARGSGAEAGSVPRSLVETQVLREQWADELWRLKAGLESALAVLDWEGAASQAHQLKGLAGIYGASSVAKLLRQIEIVVEGRDVAALEPLVSELDGQIRSATKTP